MKPRFLIILAALLAATLACNMPQQAAPTATPTLTETPTATIAPTATIEPSPTVPTPTLEPTIPPAPVNTLPPPATAVPPTPQEKRISFETGAYSSSASGTLAPYSANRYIVEVSTVGVLNVGLSPSNGSATLGIWGVNGAVLAAYDSKLTQWNGQVPAKQNYYIEVYNTTGSALKYSLQVTIPPVDQDVDTGEVQRISFSSGAVSAQVRGQMSAGRDETYVIKLTKGYTLYARLTMQAGQAILVIEGDNGDVLAEGSSGYTDFSDIIPRTQDYYIAVRNIGPDKAKYILDVGVPEATAVPDDEDTGDTSGQSLDFNGGGSQSVSGQIGAGKKDQYVFSANSGQKLKAKLSLSSGAAILVIYGEDGDVLLSSSSEDTSWSGELPTGQDYVVEVRNYGNSKARYTLQLVLQ